MRTLLALLLAGTLTAAPRVKEKVVYEGRAWSAVIYGVRYEFRIVKVDEKADKVHLLWWDPAHPEWERWYWKEWPPDLDIRHPTVLEVRGMILNAGRD